MHSISAQTKFAAQKFNGCSARGWVMLVYIPCPTNATQVVWCLVWHTLKCILPPMPLFLPENLNFTCGDTLHQSRDSCDVQAQGRCDEQEINVWHLFAPNRGHGTPRNRQLDVGAMQ